MQRKLPVIALLACLGLLMAVPFAAGRSFAIVPAYDVSVFAPPAGPNLCVYNTPPTNSVCNLPSTGTYDITPLTTDTTVTQVWVFITTPLGVQSQLSTINCNPGVCGSDTNNFNQAGHWGLTLLFLGANGLTSFKSLLNVDVFVAPQFPLGTIVAIIAPLGAFGLFLFFKKGQQLSIR